MSIGDQDAESTRPGRRRALALALVCIVGVLGFASLGVWQVQRLFWKLDLIERVAARVNAEPIAPPRPPEWEGIDGAEMEYRRVRLSGTFQNERETLVQAVTERGPGFWVMTPLVSEGGAVTIVNRGFVPGDRRDPTTRAAGQIPGPTTVTGLLRLTEPHGGFLRANDPGADRWYSRDVLAIAGARDLPNAAPFFVDADASPNAGGLPVGGLTVVAFRNSHLVYALTWFTLAALLAGAGVWAVRDERRRRQRVAVPATMGEGTLPT